MESTVLLRELIALDIYRMDHGWTWQQLADDMDKAGIPQSPRTLHHLCRRTHPLSGVRDVTLRRIQRYLEKRRIAYEHIKKDTRPAARTALYRP